MDDQERVKAIIKGFLTFLKKSKQEYLLPLFVEKLKKIKDLEKIEIFSPVCLNETQKNKASEMARKLTNDNDSVIEYQIDPTLIDGLKIRYQDRVWDISLSSQINQLLNQLL